MMLVQHATAVWFPFAVLPAPLNAIAYLTGVNSKGKIYSLCELCVSSEAPQGRNLRDASTGGEKYSFTYSKSKYVTIPHCGKLYRCFLNTTTDSYL